MSVFIDGQVGLFAPKKIFGSMFKRILSCCCSSEGRKSEAASAQAAVQGHATNQGAPSAASDGDMNVLQLIHSMLEGPIVQIVSSRLAGGPPSPKFPEALASQLEHLENYQTARKLAQVIAAGPTPQNVAMARMLAIQLAKELIDAADKIAPIVAPGGTAVTEVAATEAADTVAASEANSATDAKVEAVVAVTQAETVAAVPQVETGVAVPQVETRATIPQVETVAVVPQVETADAVPQTVAESNPEIPAIATAKVVTPANDDFAPVEAVEGEDASPESPRLENVVEAAPESVSVVINSKPDAGEIDIVESEETEKEDVGSEEKEVGNDRELYSDEEVNSDEEVDSDEETDEDLTDDRGLLATVSGLVKELARDDVQAAGLQKLAASISSGEPVSVEQLESLVSQGLIAEEDTEDEWISGDETEETVKMPAPRKIVTPCAEAEDPSVARS